MFYRIVHEGRRWRSLKQGFCSRQAEQPLRIGGGRRRQRFSRDAPQPGDGIQHMDQAGGLVTLAAMVRVRLVGRVGFQQEPLHRHGRGEAPQPRPQPATDSVRHVS